MAIITSASDFVTWNGTSNATLMNDITLTSSDYITPISITESCTFEGNNHTIT